MNLPFLHTLATNRLSALTNINEFDRSDYVRGSIDSLQWLLTEMDKILAEVLPSGMNLPAKWDDTEGEDEPDLGLPMTILPDTKMSPARPNLYSTKACLPERTHAHALNTPSKGFKQCKHCGEILKMGHGEKISFSKQRPDQHQEVLQLTNKNLIPKP